MRTNAYPRGRETERVKSWGWERESVFEKVCVEGEDEISVHDHETWTTVLLTMCCRSWASRPPSSLSSTPASSPPHCLRLWPVLSVPPRSSRSVCLAVYLSLSVFSPGQSYQRSQGLPDLSDWLSVSVCLQPWTVLSVLPRSSRPVCLCPLYIQDIWSFIRTIYYKDIYDGIGRRAACG